MPHSDRSLRLPEAFRKPVLTFKEKRDVFQILRAGNLSTVCEEARCPNIGECFSQKTATFMIMGDRCTRRCHFCSVTTKKPLSLDPHEPDKIALAVQKMGLDYVVITSVNRDELPDYGAHHFVRVVEQVKALIPSAKVELLVPDFHGDHELIDQVLNSPIDVFGHNIETVARLYKKLRPQSNFLVTQNVLARASFRAKALVKSGLMLGVGETDEEVLETLRLLKDLGVSIVTIGQYLRPSRSHWPISRFVSPETFQKFKEFGLALGFRNVIAGSFVRSSYHAKQAQEQV